MITLNGLTGITAPDFEPSSSTAPTNGMFLPTTNTLAWSTNSAERMRLDSSGNLGLGVTPSAWRTDASTKALQIGNSTFFTQSSGGNYTQVGCNVYQPSSGQNTYIASDYATKYQQYAGTHIWQIAPSGTAGNAISFTQAMTLDASGNLLVGNTATVSNSRLYVTANGNNPAARFYGSGLSDSQHVVYFDKPSATNTTSQLFVGFTVNAQATGNGQINGNGAGAAAFGSFSDSRLKENITALPNQLTNICALKPSEFDYKDGSGHQIGFIAQEMQQVYPDVVGEGENGMLTITGWSKTEARLVKAIQELSAELNELKKRVG